MPLPDYGKQGAALPSDPSGEYNLLMFLIRQALSKVNVSALVKVISVTNAGGVAPVGYVDVQPLVNQQDGFGNAVSHEVVHNLPYFRMQGGTNAIIMDPQVGDVGLAVFADKDISTVKNTKAVSNPGSKRRFDMADGIYIGGVLNGTPAQYVQFLPGSIKVVSPQIDLSSWVGMLAPFSAGTPLGWLSVPLTPTNELRSVYPALHSYYAASSYPWGNGDGSTTFGIPYCPAGYTFVGGVLVASINHGANISHTHSIYQPTGNAAGGGATFVAAYVNGTTRGDTSGSQGGADNLAAGIGANWCVKY